MLRVQTLALVWPETLMRSLQRLSCALVEFEPAQVFLENSMRVEENSQKFSSSFGPGYIGRKLKLEGRAFFPRVGLHARRLYARLNLSKTETSNSAGSNRNFRKVCFGNEKKFQKTKRI